MWRMNKSSMIMLAKDYSKLKLDRKQMTPTELCRRSDDGEDNFVEYKPTGLKRGKIQQTPTTFAKIYRINVHRYY